MRFDLVHRVQQLIRGAGPRMRKIGVLPKQRWKRQEFEGEQLDTFLANGRRQTARLAREIESYTGCSLEGRRVLDYGCGTGRNALAMAGQCEHVYGLDIMEGVLRKADATAKELGVANVEWLDASRLPELSGRYDAVVCYWVFQHIPTREGERIFAAILDGLAHGGVGAVHFALRPAWALAELRAAIARAGRDPREKMQAAAKYGYHLTNSYSLNRLGRILSKSGVTSWEVVWWYSRAPGPRKSSRFPSATLIFRKNRDPAESADHSVQRESADHPPPQPWAASSEDGFTEHAAAQPDDC
jgi:SAM-dependent methyltransferase